MKVKNEIESQRFEFAVLSRNLYNLSKPEYASMKKDIDSIISLLMSITKAFKKDN